MKRIVITGFGAISPIGLNANESFKSLLQGKHGFRRITNFVPEKLGCKTTFAAQISENFNLIHHFPFSEMSIQEQKKQIKKLDRHQVFAMIAASEAIKMAGLDSIQNKKQLDRIGVNFSTGVGGMNSFETCVATSIAGKKQSPFGNLKFLPNIAAGYISNYWNFTGPNNAHCTACAAGAHSIADGYNAIFTGEADIIIAGASEASITPVGISTFNAQTALSVNNNSIDTASRPFTVDRNGFVMGEGGACLVLESFKSAQERGAKIYAELSGFCRTADGNTGQAITSPHPNGNGAKRAILGALERSGKSLYDVDYINTHSTSTIADFVEIKAIKEVFKEHAIKVLVSATKASTGHLLGASGAIEAVFTVLSIINNTVPYTRNLTMKNIDKACLGVNHVMEKPKRTNINLALSNSFGFGGTNVCVAISSYR
ncbi:3-oxoacyl-[acyl-carrier-protein] synthase 2 [Candidatus Photodesmus katoptron]|uniref:3-oxoacyl synthase II n=1 Tax=Candidatus Photodesmus katoptron Akat1 TaxID=1236703 RepID=S3DIK5_9GAMM|nr:beta-ketoacyl-[acyl-carrier-protein] synthase family protein [Candidatus Photodesmus katoptron]EPE37555.1 3-oxoacyl synthase II [Candidatus Photodesmus katoptron Akat1]KEY90206.1 3-oxoacyl-[acyl-carrier-protein] synthase 2 [Candidatus Photodesmus katoptron]